MLHGESFQFILKLFTRSHECNNCNLYKRKHSTKRSPQGLLATTVICTRGSTVLKGRHGGLLATTVICTRGSTVLKGRHGGLLAVCKVGKKFEMIVQKSGYVEHDSTGMQGPHPHDCLMCFMSIFVKFNHTIKCTRCSTISRRHLS